MRVVRPRVAFISAALFSTSSFAATVNATQGQVLVNQGQGYQQVPGSVEAGPGATVVVNPGGSAQILYPDGCSVAVQRGPSTRSHLNLRVWPRLARRRRE